jgi:hypothetical protein
LNERAGFEFAERGRFTAAGVYFNRALHIYKHEWGTVAKYNHLKHASALASRDHPKKNIKETVRVLEPLSSLNLYAQSRCWLPAVQYKQVTDEDTASKLNAEINLLLRSYC